MSAERSTIFLTPRYQCLIVHCHWKVDINTGTITVSATIITLVNTIIQSSTIILILSVVLTVCYITDFRTSVVLLVLILCMNSTQAVLLGLL